jgi:O-antigen/teichoic acid export membrane protein
LARVYGLVSLVSYEQSQPMSDKSFVVSDGSPRHSDKVMMLAATMARMAIGMLTFIALARYLGPAPFGVIAAAIAYATFVGIVTDFGLAVYTLRIAAMRPAEAGLIVRDAIATKTLLSIVALMVLTPFVVWLTPMKHWLVYLLVYVGSTCASLGDLALIVVRARRRFVVEAKLVVGTSLLLMLGVAGAAALTRDIAVAAIAFMITRIIYLLIIIGALLSELTAPATHGIARRVVDTLIKARAFALDSVLTSLSSQIDVLLFGALLTAYDMGIYQAGARLVQVITPFAVVLSSVYMPSLSAAIGEGDDESFRRNSDRLNIEFTVLAICGGVGFAFAGPPVTHLLFGQRYASLTPLWAGFGAFAMLRFASSAYGIQLAALGHIRTRIAAQLLTVGTFVGVATWALPRFGLPATSWLLAMSGLPVLMVLGIGLLCDTRSGRSTKWSIAATLLAALGLWLI